MRLASIVLAVSLAACHSKIKPKSRSAATDPAGGSGGPAASPSTDPEPVSPAADVLPPFTSTAVLRDLIAKGGAAVSFSLSTDLNGDDLTSVKVRIEEQGVAKTDWIAADRSGDQFRFVVPAGISVRGGGLRVQTQATSGRRSEATAGPLFVSSTTKGITGKLDEINAQNSEPAAAAVRLRIPTTVALVGRWLYIGEFGRFSRFNLDTNLYEAVAGMIATSSGDSRDGSREVARIGDPSGSIASLGSHLYFAEPAGHIVRQLNIDDTSPDFGKVVTVGGALASPGFVNGDSSNSRFDTPTGVATDGVKIYVTDRLNHVVRTLDPQNGFVTATVAGTPQVSGTSVASVAAAAAVFNQPTSLAYKSPYLYVLDNSNAVLRRIDLVDGLLTTSEVFGIRGSFGVTTGAAGLGRLLAGETIAGLDASFVYLASIAGQLRRVELTTGISSVVAGTAGTIGFADGPGSTAQFGFPTNGTVSGNYAFIPERRGGSIRKVDLLTGAVSTIVGLGLDPQKAAASSYQGDLALIDYTRGITTDDGVVYYVTQRSGHTVLKIDLAAQMVTSVAGSAFEPGYVNGVGSTARFNLPWGIAKVGNTLYVADDANFAVRAIDLLTNNVTTFAGADPVAGQGTLGFLDATGSAARFRGPTSMASDGSSLFVADRGNHRIRRISLSDAGVSTLAGSTGGFADGTGAAAQFSLPQGLTLSQDATKVYVGDVGNAALRLIDIGSGAVSTLANDLKTDPSQILPTPYSLAATATHVYVGDPANLKIKSYRLSDGQLADFAGGATMKWASGVGVGKASEVGAVLALNSARVQVAPSQWHDLLAFGSSSFTSIFRFDIQEGSSEALAGPTKSGLFAFRGAKNGKTFRPDAHFAGGIRFSGGKIFVYDPVAGVIRRFNPDGSDGSVVAGKSGVLGSLDGAGGAARLVWGRGLATDGAYLYLSETEGHTIRRVSLQDFQVATVAGQPGEVGSVDGIGAAARFNGPRGLCLGDKVLFVPDSFSHVIRSVSLAEGTYGLTETVAGLAGAAGSTDAQGVAARFSDPIACEVIGGDLYVYDAGTRILRQIDLTTRNVKTVLGSATSYTDVRMGVGAAAALNAVQSVLRVGANLLLGTDDGLIVRFDPSTGEASLFAGKIGNRLGGGPGSFDLSGALPMVGYMDFSPELGLVFATQDSIYLSE